MKLIDTRVDFLTNSDPNDTDFTIKRTQEIPTEHLERLKTAKEDTRGRPSGEFHRVASVPTALYDQWIKEGYDMSKEPVTRTIAKLRAADLHAFITTTKF